MFQILSLEEEVDNKEGEMTLLKHKLSEEVKVSVGRRVLNTLLFKAFLSQQ